MAPMIKNCVGSRLYFRVVGSITMNGHEFSFLVINKIIRGRKGFFGSSCEWESSWMWDEIIMSIGKSKTVYSSRFLGKAAGFSFDGGGQNDKVHFFVRMSDFC